ncbi:hypothetical protein [Streptomyces physcomitrii]|uniref:Uncharacterized protein n=1 Tax=Streptomyces physcomitrii TaxID=2724184 RepID=A0ABX1HB63_9ACTN|nr:hypothetical protein [Streptomyces physcomitrii]NKI44560.1 hypothetical protein [Streptomyces physcomitrii]
MITSTPVGDWTWAQEFGEGEEATSGGAAEKILSVWKILARHALADSTRRGEITVRRFAGKREVIRDFRNLPLEDTTLSGNIALNRATSEVDALSGDFLITLRFPCPGYWTEKGHWYRAKQLFCIQADIWKKSLVVYTVETYSDAWLTMDTREREQKQVHAENHPRLTAALGEISLLLGVPTTPGDPNVHATPTSEGFENLAPESAAYADSWGTFEVPERARILRSRIPKSENDYEEVTDSPVHYFSVQRDGRTFGYVWAADIGSAAGFEPRTAADEEALAIGGRWLLRLRDAHSQGVSAQDLLTWLSRLAPDPEAGSFGEDTPQRFDNLDGLEELSGRY